MSQLCKYVDNDGNKCKTRASFGYNSYERCAKHRPAGMPSRSSKQCKDPSCSKEASYGINKAEYCVSHKTSKMEYMKKIQKCSDPSGCTKKAYYGKEKGKPLSCAGHKKEGYRNVVSKTCADPTCWKLPAFNKSGCKTGIYCKKHALPGMENVRYTPRVKT
jgi:hypothetical protein